MTKSAGLRVRVEPDLHRRFLSVCKAQHLPAAQVLRRFMRDYVERYGQAEQRDLFSDSAGGSPNED